MSIIDIISKINDLKSKIDSLGKLSDDVLNKVNYKFRLDWNYHSNSMEGNSLTQQETRSVMINNVTIEGKPIKDVLEIKGHDKIISEILKIGKGELRLSEKRIKEIHKAIIHEENPEKQAKIGHWKTENNHLINYKGEKFDFLPHPEVPEAMHQLMNWLNAECEKIDLNKDSQLHPALLAFQFHLRYVSIHPFYDGNGRTARILTNLILISFGYPPIVIKISNKNAYNQYLADIQAYGGSDDLYYKFMGKQLIHSLELILNAIEGKDIDEPDDLDKKLSLLEKELDAIETDHEVKLEFSSEVYLKMYHGWISELLRKAIPVIQKFNRFFAKNEHALKMGSMIRSINFTDESVDDIIQRFNSGLNINLIPDNPDVYSILLKAYYGQLIKGGLNTFDCTYGLNIVFEKIKYCIYIQEFGDNITSSNLLFENLLHKPLSTTEMDELVKKLGDTIYNHIDHHTKEKGIR